MSSVFLLASKKGTFLLNKVTSPQEAWWRHQSRRNIDGAPCIVLSDYLQVKVDGVVKGIFLKQGKGLCIFID